jgi:cytochrome c oxidase subunit 4
MTRLKLYTAIYVVLFVLATGQVALEGFLEADAAILGVSAYWWVFIGIMVVSMFKAVVVAGYFQHLRWEPRSLTYLMLLGLGAALALTLAAAYSIT